MPAFTLKAAAVSIAVGLAADPVSAFWRMTCPGRLILERIDPIVSANAVSGHVHTVSGGSGFGFNTTFQQQRNSACSSCPIKADLSAYWTPKLYWRNKDNTQFKDVPQSGEYNGMTGGMNVYYQQRYSSGSNRVQAFPADFRMLAGDPFARSFNDTPAAPGQAVSFVCLDYANGSKQYQAIPNHNCPQGVRAQVYFPSCWDGVNKDFADHKSHMAYPIGGSYDSGSCPTSHPVRLISLFYEVIYSTDQFADQWWSSTQHPFVFAMGDTTGYGFHGDFVNGWDIPTLQKAADTCTASSGKIADCPVFNNGLFTDAQCQACRLPPQVDELTTGTLPALPGCNPVTSGPQHAAPGVCAQSSAGQAVIRAPKQFYTDMTASQWAYQGCGTDAYASRTLTGASKSDPGMTVESCLSFCKTKGLGLAGLEYGRECYCGNGYNNAATTAPRDGILGACTMPCAGNAAQTCGGPSALSVYKACTAGTACSNAVFVVNGTASDIVSSSASSSWPSVNLGPLSSSSSSSPSSSPSSMVKPTATTIRRRHLHKHKSRTLKHGSRL